MQQYFELNGKIFNAEYDDEKDIMEIDLETYGDAKIKAKFKDDTTTYIFCNANAGDWRMIIKLPNVESIEETEREE